MQTTFHCCIKGVPGFLKRQINLVGRLLNLRLETLTAERVEEARLLQLRRRGYFDEPAFPLPSGFADLDTGRLQNALSSFRTEIERLEHADANTTRYFVDNDYCTSPDMEVYYSIIRLYQPAMILEIGSGFSTRVARQASLDAGLQTRLISVDPSPRSDVDALCDEVVRRPLEEAGIEDRILDLGKNDILYIDSSHQLRCGNDVLSLAFNALPRLKPGVLVHFHDIFLPFDYPWDFVHSLKVDWTEQYLVQAILQYSTCFGVVWPGHYLQRTLPDFARRFPTLRQGRAQSLWLKRKS